MKRRDNNTPSNQPAILAMAGYYGESVGLYFGFLFYYTVGLFWIGVFGCIMGIVQLATRTFDGILVPVYCFVLTIWMIILKKRWHLKEAELAYKWHTTQYSGSDTTRREFSRELVVDEATSKFRTMGFTNTRLRAWGFTILLLGVGVGMIIGWFSVFLIWRERQMSVEMWVLVSALNAVVIIIFRKAYTLVAKVLTDQENHKYQDSYDSSFGTKLYGFQFLNNYLSLSAVAFSAKDFRELSYGIGISIVVNQLLDILTLHLLPRFLHWFKTRSIDRFYEQIAKEQPHDDKKLQREKELDINCVLSYPINVPRAYCDLFIQMGYVGLFSCAFPVVPLLVFLGSVGRLWGTCLSMLS